MAIIFDSTLLELALGVVLVFCVYYIHVRNYSYWSDRSIVYDKPSFPFGTDKQLILLQHHMGTHYQRVYEKFKDQKVIGMFQMSQPYLVIRDVALIKQIVTRDFQHFVDRGFHNPDVLLPINRHLFNMQGESWKAMRNKLTPAFTSGKMKLMYYLMETCCNQFIDALHDHTDNDDRLAVKDFIACFTTDVIASCAFGLQSNSIKQPDNEFRKNGQKIFDAPSLLTVLKERFAISFPELFKRLPLELSTGTESLFLKLVDNTLKYREKNGVVRNDFIDILIKIKNNKSLLDEETNGNMEHLKKDVTSDKPGLTLEEMTGQAMLFFAAGFETAASAITFCLYEMSLNPEIQKKARKECDEVFEKNSGKPNYQALQEMTYLEAVINETLRSLAVLNRQCTKDYKLPGSDLVIPKGMKIIIPTYAVHHDPEYYPEPYKFDPERFTDDKIDTKNNCTFMPFGGGPRMCLGNRFAMMQMKLSLSMILHNFELSVADETPIPITISPSIFVTAPESPIVLKISKLNQD